MFAKYRGINYFQLGVHLQKTLICISMQYNYGIYYIRNHFLIFVGRYFTDQDLRIIPLLPLVQAFKFSKI